jgi:hypothetical protein
MQNLFVKPFASLCVEAADVLNPKQELLRLPSKADIVYAAAEGYFSQLLMLGRVNEYNYQEVVEQVTTAKIIDNWGIINGMEEEMAIWNTVNLKLMSYAGRKYPNT